MDHHIGPCVRALSSGVLAIAFATGSVQLAAAASTVAHPSGAAKHRRHARPHRARKAIRPRTSLCDRNPPASQTTYRGTGIIDSADPATDSVRLTIVALVSDGPANPCLLGAEPVFDLSGAMVTGQRDPQAGSHATAQDFRPGDVVQFGFQRSGPPSDFEATPLVRAGHIQLQQLSG